MKKLSIIYILLIFLTFFSNLLFAQRLTNEVLNSKSANQTNDNLDLVQICKWKDNAKTCVNFSFDDGTPSFRRISQFFDLYDFKASFFIIASSMQIDSIKDIYERGHEIASHSYSHPLFEVLDSLQLDYQIRKGKEVLENAVGIKCVTFGEPGNFRSQLCKSIAFKHHLFVRHYSEYQEIERIELDLQQRNLSQVIPTIQSAISKGMIVQFVAHSINGEGYLPIIESTLIEQLDLVKNFSDQGIIWVTSVKDGLCYENLYHEVSLNKTLIADTLKLDFHNYNKDKYKDLDSTVLSVEIPFTVAKEINIVSGFVKMKKLSDKYILNADLKIDTSLVVILNSAKTDLNRVSRKNNEVALDSFQAAENNIITRIKTLDIK